MTLLPSDNQEFQAFLQAEEARPPQGLSEHILSQVHGDLHPSAWKILGKLSLIHLVVANLTLLFCPQFGVGWTKHLGLLSALMNLGHTVCMASCGMIFVGLSLLAASLLLYPEELRALRKKAAFQVASISLLSLAVLICFGATMVWTVGLAWFGGALLGGLVSVELVFRTRRHIWAM